MSTQVDLPDALRNWIASHLPLYDLRHIQFRVCERLPFSWILRSRNFVGLTLWNRVYVLEHRWTPETMTRDSVELIFHELVHVSQFRRNPVAFPFRYLFHHLRFGYERNPAEIEAREIAARHLDKFFSK